jgi:hypothetical protein
VGSSELQTNLQRRLAHQRPLLFFAAFRLNGQSNAY